MRDARGDENDVERRHALVTGGGTGGHVFPGVALARELGRRGWNVSFAGRSGQMEEQLAVRLGIPFHAVSASPLLGASPVEKISTLFSTVSGAWSGRRLVRQQGVDVVVGMGGYVSVPAVLGARLAGKPSIVFEPNAAAGLANRWLSRVANEAAVAFEAAAAELRCGTTTTGTPVREEFFSQPSSVPTDPLRLLVLGGSQGATQLNELVPEALGQLGRAVGDLEVLHQAGPAHVETTRAAYAGSVFQGAVDVVPFLDDVAGALGRASLVVSRAGAITLAEISAVGRPAVLIPLAIAAGHQAANARALVEAGGAEMLPSDGGAEALARALAGMLGSPARLEEMGSAAAAAGRRDAVERFADRVVAQMGEN